jgi:hypothetical protein
MRITLSRAWTNAAGVTYQADETPEVPANTARSLLHHGHARPAAAELEQPAPEPEPETHPRKSNGAAKKEA